MIPICLRYGSDMIPIWFRCIYRIHIGSISEVYGKHVGSTWEHIGTISGDEAENGRFEKGRNYGKKVPTIREKGFNNRGKRFQYFEKKGSIIGEKGFNIQEKNLQ